MRSRRFATRREITVPCQAVRERDFKLIADRTLDVSVDGLLLPLGDVVVATGETLIVSFPIPGTWIDAEATVTRVVHGRRPGDEGAAVGVAFHVIGAASRAALAGFLHGRPPPLPRRGPLSRMRRGFPAPRLADHALMDRLVPLASELDVQDVQDVDEANEEPEALARSRISEGRAHSEARAVSVLREVGKAWRDIFAAYEST